MEKPKVRIILTIKKLYELADKRYIDFVCDHAEIRIRLDDNFTLEIKEISPDRLVFPAAPSEMVN